MNNTNPWSEDASMRDVELEPDGSILNYKPDFSKIKEIELAKGDKKIAFDGHVHGPYSIENLPFAAEFLQKYKARFQEAVMPFQAVLRRADQAGLNAISIVGHNNINDAVGAITSYRKICDSLDNLKYVVGGVELNQPEGHFLVYFLEKGHPSDIDLEDLLNRFLSLEAQLKESPIHSIDTTRYMHENNIIAGPAHPFSKIPRLQRPACYDNGKINYAALTKLNFVEVRNGFGFTEFNEIAEKVYSALDDKFGFDFEVAQTGNSDSHIVPHIGSCFTTMPDTTDFSYNSLQNVLKEKKTKVHGSPNDSYKKQLEWFSAIAAQSKEQMNEQLRKRQNPDLVVEHKLFDSLHGDKPTWQLLMGRMLFPGSVFAIKYFGGTWIIHSYYSKEARLLRDEMLASLDTTISGDGIPDDAIDLSYAQARITDYETPHINKKIEAQTI